MQYNVAKTGVAAWGTGASDFALGSYDNTTVVFFYRSTLQAHQTKFNNQSSEASNNIISSKSLSPPHANGKCCGLMQALGTN